MTNDTQLILKRFWENHFGINCVTHIDNVSIKVNYKTIKSSRRKLWLDCLPESNIKGFAYVTNAEKLAIVEKVGSLQKSIGLEVGNEDNDELVEEYRTKLSGEEVHFVHLRGEQQKIVVEEISCEEEEVRKNVPNAGLTKFIQNEMKRKVLLKILS